MILLIVTKLIVTCLSVVVRIFVHMFVHIFSVLLVAVAYHANMLDYKECAGNDCKGGRVGIRWP